MNSDGALAIFVKTPGLSPVKTRLAASIGKEAANRFYTLSLAATAAVAKLLQTRISDLHIYWAVAEPEGRDAKIWSGFPVIFQGNGSLGERLNFVYKELLKKHNYICFMGADSPHITVEELGLAVLLTAKNVKKKFIIGETLDGGFYFFGGSVSLPDSVWLKVKYSTTQTAHMLMDELRKCGKLKRLKKHFDIDTIDDLFRYADKSFNSVNFLPEQMELINSCFPIGC